MDEREKRLYRVVVVRGLFLWIFELLANNEVEAWLDVLLHSREIEVDDEHYVELLE